MTDKFYIGKNIIEATAAEVNGRLVRIGEDLFYEIGNYDLMQPFFISVTGDSDLWMFISSTGALTAGRMDPDHSLFPYYTDDKIHDAAETTGSKTILQVSKDGCRYLWEPFSDRYKNIWKTERTILKSTVGNKIIFCEKNLDLELSFSYTWMNAAAFGWIRECGLVNHAAGRADVVVLDGLQNILPAGIDRLTQNTFSTLVDGYKKNELVPGTRVALYRMESVLVDRAEPAESLRANVVWSYGTEGAEIMLDSRQLNDFRSGRDVVPQKESRGVRGAYFVCSGLTLNASESRIWGFVAETGLDSVQLVDLIDRIDHAEDMALLIRQNVEAGTEQLRNIVAGVDGVQHTADQSGIARHFANVLFNCMRGGVFRDGYLIFREDFILHVKRFNAKTASANEAFLSSLPGSVEYDRLETLILERDDADLYRLFLEYLPLTFSRRHGDPSRPWNLFNIKVRDEAGNTLISYQGNWRDIFQNWEALLQSYPEYAGGVVAKFLNATTADGYNPYKITHEGIEWEVIEEDNPWSNIGYWGDHQIIYLEKLLEVFYSHYPEKLLAWLDRKIFAYANVPYRIRSYPEIVADPQDTIFFDDRLHEAIGKLQGEYGADARLVLNEEGNVKMVSLTEKILVTLLAKLSNFIPEAGIWMNTLRPEWNDANNALVGQGASMVTVYYMRRFVAFVRDLYLQSSVEEFPVSGNVNRFLTEVSDVFRMFEGQLPEGFDDLQRRLITDRLGNAGWAYRDDLYQNRISAEAPVAKKVLVDFMDLTLRYIDRSISVNKRQDDLYHAYNLVKFTEDGSVRIGRLSEMLEGQVAVLTSGKLDASETVALLDALRNSALYRADQQSYMLYPDKKLPLFLEKNNIAPEEIEKSKLLKLLVSRGDTAIVRKDKKGMFHFNAGFRNARFLNEALDGVKIPDETGISPEDRRMVEELYEQVFNHQSFTGRSGTFYKYEGLGCIYWHMVSKLLLAVGENIVAAEKSSADPSLIETLKRYFSEIKAGIGAQKSPAAYGSFPFDPYSHTPSMAGVQQPGMTGQVKEDIISRFMELGMQVEKGRLKILPGFLNESEFVVPGFVPDSEAPALSFSYCSVPFVFLKDGKSGMDVVYTGNGTEHISGYEMDETLSSLIFKRSKNIRKIVVHFANPNY